YLLRPVDIPLQHRPTQGSAHYSQIALEFSLRLFSSSCVTAQELRHRKSRSQSRRTLNRPSMKARIALRLLQRRERRRSEQLAAPRESSLCRIDSVGPAAFLFPPDRSDVW